MQHIIDLAQHQGYVTAAQVSDLGRASHTLGRLVADGRLVRASRGIYLPPGARFRPQTHALLVKATLDDDPFAIASHHSALALHGIALFDVDWGQVHLLDARTSSRIRDHRHWHVLREGDEVVDVGGYRVAGVPLALAQVAAQFGIAAGMVAIDDALHRGVCTRDDVASVLASGRLRRGVVAARRAVELADERTESPGESRLRWILANSPWHFEIQAEIGGPGAGYRVDHLVEGRLVVEFDGAMKYDGPTGRAALLAEKTREDWIRERGYGVLRVVWSELDHPAQVQRRISRTLLQTPLRLP